MSKPERNVIVFEDILARDGKSNVLFLNYDNEAFMNTGIQESGATPPFASTTTGQGVKKFPEKSVLSKIWSLLLLSLVQNLYS